MYRTVSKKIHSPLLLRKLRTQFSDKLSIPDLIAWVHTKITFDKGNISRHYDPLEIIKYGRGKCREFSILFTAVCLAHGYRSRLVLDLSDHAWTEIFDLKIQRWIHVDPSEKKIDDPKMYERDWKKNLKAVYAFEKGLLNDVTEQYKLVCDKV